LRQKLKPHHWPANGKAAGQNNKYIKDSLLTDKMNEARQNALPPPAQQRQIPRRHPSICPVRLTAAPFICPARLTAAKCISRRPALLAAKITLPLCLTLSPPVRTPQ